jgi:hypothetical protein
MQHMVCKYATIYLQKQLCAVWRSGLRRRHIISNHTKWEC